MKPIKKIICSSVLLAAVISVGATPAYAKPAPAAASKCQAAAGTGNADLESTRSACRLVDGAVGFAARPNTGDGAVEEFNAVRPEPTLRQPQFSSATSSLPLPDATAGKSPVAAGGAVTDDGWGSGHHTDIFVQPTRQSPLEGWTADGGAYGRVTSNASAGNDASNVPFSSFAASSGYRAQDVAATSGGNARPGIGANNTNTGTPVVDTTTPSSPGAGTGDVTTPSGLGDGTTPAGTNDGSAGTGTGTGDAGTGLGDGTVGSGIGDGTTGLGGDGANPANPTEVPAVPEPQTYLMLLVGLAMVVGLGRKARRTL